MPDPRSDPGFIASLVQNGMLDRRTFLRGGLALSAGAAAAYGLACGSDSKPGAPTKAPTLAPGATPYAAAVRPVLLTSEFVAGYNNRSVLGLLRPDGKLVIDAGVHLRFFQADETGSSGTLRGDGDAAFTQLNIEGAHTHDSTTGDAANEDAISFYVANAPFDAPGKWGVEIAVTPDDGSPSGSVQVPIEVLAEPKTPALGTVPPASQNDTSATNSNPESLCSRSPICGLHDKTIADVLGKGRPLVVQFSTPAFCQTRFCGPVLEVLLSQVPAYQDRVDFVHIEVWQDFQLQQYRPAMTEWKLSTEPWTFFMNSKGEVVLRLEAIFTEEDAKSALDQLVNL